MITTTYFWIGTAAMAIGTLAFARAFVRDPRNRTYHAILTGIAGTALVAYVLMALGIGKMTAASGTVVKLPRYVEWIFSTTLIVVYLGLLAGIDRQYITLLVVLDVAVMALGLGSALTAGAVKWTLFGVSSVVYIGLIYWLTRGITRAVQRRPTPVIALFEKLRNVTVIIWTIYPVLFALGPHGIGLMTANTTVLLITYADVIAKVLFGFIALNRQTSLGQTSLARLPELDVLTFGIQTDTDGSTRR